MMNPAEGLEDASNAQLRYELARRRADIDELDRQVTEATSLTELLISHSEGCADQDWQRLRSATTTVLYDLKKKLNAVNEVIDRQPV